MDYYGLLFLYYLKGLSGKSVLRLFFNIEAGGTEQLLPENTSAPTTTPILADIQYPDGLRTDQYFTYRETPTTISNKARIKTIKGQTLKWNQLSDHTKGQSAGTINGVTFSFVDGAVNIDGTATTTFSFCPFYFAANSYIEGHKYIVGSATVKPNHLIMGANSTASPFPNGYRMVNFALNPVIILYNGETYSNEKIYPQIFDLTQMFGSSKADEIYAMEQATEGSGVAYFKSLFPLDYYSYNAGTLLSFNGTGLKSVGKNLLNYLNNRTASDITFTYDQSSGAYKVEGTLSLSDAWSDVGINGTVVQNYPRLRKGTYKVSGFNSTILGRIQAWYDDGTNEVIIATIDSTMLFTLNQDAYVYIRGHVTGQGTSFNETIYPMITFADADQTFEPYTSSTLSLPISTYFPSGMKSAGNVYDELTPSKAITRIGAVDLGTLTWQLNGTRMQADIGTTFSNWNYNQECPKYTSNDAIAVSSPSIDKIMGVYRNRILIYDSSFADPAVFKIAMNGVYLYYELATPTETPITTEDTNEALSLLMGKSVSSSNANQLIDIITKGE